MIRRQSIPHCRSTPAAGKCRRQNHHLSARDSFLRSKALWQGSQSLNCSRIPLRNHLGMRSLPGLEAMCGTGCQMSSSKDSLTGSTLARFQRTCLHLLDLCRPTACPGRCKWFCRRNTQPWSSMSCWLSNSRDSCLGRLNSLTAKHH